MRAVATLQTPFGNWGVGALGDVITTLNWNVEAEGEMTPLLAEGIKQLKAYVAGNLQNFDLPLAPKGTDFQQKVYAAMSAIPYGETLTYGEIADALGVPAQPIGQACGSNPIPIIIPCHRVLSKTGTGGFSGWGGVESKIALLRHESGFSFLI
ncbi:MAG: methylated-DNA--[protein]-cysteine S-methyltransferase [Rhodobacteraceae bacterium]|nr:methylated-DNA--[protein]-cysteine S-methyltransferase [Paracoccaceae bacterium]